MSQKIVSRTHFTKRDTESQGWQWFWATKAANDSDTVAVGGEGYYKVDKAINGFFASQGESDWEPGLVGMQSMPEDYKLEKIDDSHYVIYHYEEEENGV